MIRLLALNETSNTEYGFLFGGARTPFGDHVQEFIPQWILHKAIHTDSETKVSVNKFLQQLKSVIRFQATLPNGLWNFGIGYNQAEMKFDLILPWKMDSMGKENLTFINTFQKDGIQTVIETLDEFRVDAMISRGDFKSEY